MNRQNRLSKDISCRIIVDLLRFTKTRGIDPSVVFNTALLQTLHPQVASLEYLSRPGNWIDWSSFVKIHLAMYEHVFPTPELRQEFIETSLSEPAVWVKVFFPLMSIVIQPRMLYRLVEWGGHLNFKNIKSSYNERADGTCVLKLSLGEGEDPLPEYFEMCAYTFEFMPTIIGYERAEVHADLTPTSGSYRITFPSKRRRLQRFRRTLNYLRAYRGFDRSIEAWESSRIELQHSTQMLSSILENSPDTIMLVDRDSVIHYINKVAEGIDVDVVGMRASEFIPEASRERHKDSLIRVCDHSEKVDFETQALHDGSIWHSKMVPITAPSGERMVLVIASDITKQKVAAQNIITARNQALAASRAKDVFLANMSHEVRTPLTAIIGFSEVLQKHQLTPDAMKSVDIIARNGKHLLTLINDILSISKIEADEVSVRRDEFDPVQIIRDIVDSHRIKVGKKAVTVDVQFDTGVPERIVADRTHLTQIFSNLLENALKFTDRGHVAVAVSFSDNHLNIEVADSGCGIPQESVETIFEPFRQIDMSGSRTHGGSGLGLGIARKLARKNGGDVELATTALDKGSTFRITFPYGVSGGLSPASIIDARPIDMANKKILVVDDNPDIAVLLTILLESAKAQVTKVLHGKDALSFGDLQNVDLILLDLQMPGMDGYETFSKIKETGFKGKIIAISAHAGENEQQKCRNIGFDAYLSKPVSNADLMAILNGQLR